MSAKIPLVLSRAAAVAVISASAVLAGCAVGPSFQLPPAFWTDKFPAEGMGTGTTAPPSAAGVVVQRLQFGQDLPGNWWKLFGSPKLNALIDAAMAKNLDIVAQQAALRASMEAGNARSGVLFPEIQGVGDATREKVSGASIGPGFPGFKTNVFQTHADVSYAFDFFGGERRAIEGLQAQALLQNSRLEVSYLTLTTSVVATAVHLAALHDEIAATQKHHRC